jgi:hypothetical protein
LAAVSTNKKRLPRIAFEGAWFWRRVGFIAALG